MKLTQELLERYANPFKDVVASKALPKKVAKDLLEVIAAHNTRSCGGEESPLTKRYRFLLEEVVGDKRPSSLDIDPPDRDIELRREFNAALALESLLPGVARGSLTELLLKEMKTRPHLGDLIPPGKWGNSKLGDKGRNEYCYSHSYSLDITPQEYANEISEQGYKIVQENFDPQQWRDFGSKLDSLYFFSDETLANNLTPQELALIPRESFHVYRQEIGRGFSY